MDNYQQATARMHEGQKLLMAQNETIQKLNREMVSFVSGDWRIY